MHSGLPPLALLVNSAPYSGEEPLCPSFLTVDLLLAEARLRADSAGPSQDLTVAGNPCVPSPQSSRTRAGRSSGLPGATRRGCM